MYKNGECDYGTKLYPNQFSHYDFFTLSFPVPLPANNQILSLKQVYLKTEKENIKQQNLSKTKKEKK